MPDFNLSFKEQVVNKYPWYSIGYYDIFREICKIDAEASGLYLDKVAPRVFSRGALYDMYLLYSSNGSESNYDESFSEGGENIDITIEPEEAPIDLEGKDSKKQEQLNVDETEIVFEEISDFTIDNTKTEPNFVLAGGDYFTRKELDQLELDKSKPVDNFIATKPSLVKTQKEKESQKKEAEKEISTSDLFDDYSFYTETLAKIYQEQGFYKRAVDVYAKLILLYPEKSSYFATLVDKIKEKYNH